jgi:signal peptidase I
MECSSCGFENMPGSDACGRCASSLRLATAVMDVRPPRAGKFAKRLRRALPMRRAYFGVRDAFEDVHLPSLTGSTWIFDNFPAWPLLWRLFIPGWSHFHAGQRIRGHAFLWGFVALLLPGLLFMGTTLGSILLGLAFSVHTSAALDVFNQAAPPCGMRRMFARSILVSIVLALCIYLPIGWLLARVAAARTMEMTAEPFLAGDVVLVNQSRRANDSPRPGQVVLYLLPAQQTDPQHGRIYGYDGERIDRVLAVAGDRVVWAKGALTVNGAASPWRPLNEAVLPTRLALTVPRGCVFIIPSTTPNLSSASPAALWVSLSCVPREQVAGTVYLRSQPLSRLKVIR